MKTAGDVSGVGVTLCSPGVAPHRGLQTGQTSYMEAICQSSGGLRELPGKTVVKIEI